MLAGKKVVLRPIDIERDLDVCAAWINDPEVMRFLGAPFRPITKNEERDLLEKLSRDRTKFFFAIETQGGLCIGTTSLVSVLHYDGTATAGMMIGDKNFWGRGYGTDALMQLLYFAFTVQNLRRINAAAIAFNRRSINCQKRCGFEIEGVKRKEVYKNGRYHDLVMLAVFRKEWSKIWRAYLKKSG